MGARNGVRTMSDWLATNVRGLCISSARIAGADNPRLTVDRAKRSISARSSSFEISGAIAGNRSPVSNYPKRRPIIEVTARHVKKFSQQNALASINCHRIIH